jgi:hypothetical protein
VKIAAVSPLRNGITVGNAAHIIFKNQTPGANLAPGVFVADITFV